MNLVSYHIQNGQFQQLFEFLTSEKKYLIGPYSSNRLCPYPISISVIYEWPHRMNTQPLRFLYYIIPAAACAIIVNIPKFFEITIAEV